MPMTDEFRPSGRHTIARRFLQISADDAILEVGCNTGYFCRRYLIGRARTVRAIDIDPKAVEYAKVRDGDEYYACANGNALPFDDNEFDKVLCADTLEHVDDEEARSRRLPACSNPADYSF